MAYRPNQHWQISCKQALLKSGSLNVKDVQRLYLRATFALKDASVPTKEKEKLKDLVNAIVKRLNKSYDALIRDKAQTSSCPQLEIVLNNTVMCYKVDDLIKHWKSQKLKWTDDSAREYPSVYTIPNLDEHVILKQDVDRVLRYYSSPSASLVSIKWFMMPRPTHSKVPVHDDEADTTTSRKLCMLAPSRDPGVLQRQLEAEDALKKLSLVKGGHKSAQFRTNGALWERIKKKVIAEEVAGTAAGAWSARKAQLAVKRYKDAGGDYIGKKSDNNSLVKWTKQDWTTKSGRPSHITGERYLPRHAIEHLSSQEYNATTRAKRKGTREGKQYVAQPKTVADKTRKYRD